MANIAFFTFGLLRAPYYDPQITALGELLEPVWAAAEISSGFPALSRQEETSYGRTWGPLAVPSQFRKEKYAMRILITLSLWQDLESVFAFTYHGLHAKALARRKEWFVPADYPGYAARWAADDHTPTWHEACERLDTLHRAGPTADAFDFKHPFSVDDQPAELDRAAVKEKAAQYRPTPQPGTRLSHYR